MKLEPETNPLPLTDALATLFPREVMVEAAAPEGGLEGLYREEREHISGAHPGRQAEYATARRCARRALARLGLSPSPLPTAEDRLPRWPAGVVGSISHTRGLCAAAVAIRGMVRSVGLDLERDGRIRDALWGTLYTEGEQRDLEKRGEAERALLATVVFSAKEAFYKAQYPLTGRYLGFRDLEISIRSHGELTIQLRVAVGGYAPGDRIAGRWAHSGDLIGTGVVLPG